MTARKGKKWRHVYPYICTLCAKDRIAFRHERAVAGICSKCQRTIPHKDQAPLFHE